MSGIDSLFSGMRISSSGLTAERVRIDTIAENIANARTTSTPEGGPYRRKVVQFQPILEQAIGGATYSGVQASRVIPDYQSDFERVLEPGHPDAGPDGMVLYPNVNAVLEMADLITALRAYEANITAQESYMQMVERALELAR